VVPGIDGRKMSKSYNNTILIFEEPSQIKKKVMSIKTDSRPIEEPKDPEQDNLYALYRLFAPPDRAEEMAERYRRGGVGYGEVKKELVGLITDYFAPYRDRRAELLRDQDYVQDVLKAGGQRARAEAQKTLQMARDAAGV